MDCWLGGTWREVCFRRTGLEGWLRRRAGLEGWLGGTGVEVCFGGTGVEGLVTGEGVCDGNFISVTAWLFWIAMTIPGNPRASGSTFVSMIKKCLHWQNMDCCYSTRTWSAIICNSSFLLSHSSRQKTYWLSLSLFFSPSPSARESGWRLTMLTHLYIKMNVNPRGFRDGFSDYAVTYLRST